LVFAIPPDVPQLRFREAGDDAPSTPASALYECSAWKAPLRPNPGDCYVFCTYGSKAAGPSNKRTPAADQFYRVCGFGL